METEEIRYDQKADVLYLWSKNPEETGDIISEETGNEVLLEREKETGELVGVTILHFSKRDDAVEGINLSTPELSEA